MNNFQEGEELVTIASNDPGDIIKRAKEIMKISETDKFSYSVLSIEYHFPDPASSTHAPRLTLIDLPRLVAVEDRETLEAYTRKYIERKTALVLAVADGTADPENLRILKVVNDSACADRTFGIITKPDMMYPKSDLEAVWVRQVMDPKPRQFGLGSHVVCNRSPSELQPGAYQRTLDDRDSREAEFFAAETRFPPNATENGENQKLPNGWHRVYTMKPSDRWGIQNLRNRLAALLSDMASERVLPIYRGVQAAIKKKRDELAMLKGKDPKQMKAHLKAAVYHLRKLAAQASIGSYKEQPSTNNYKSRPYFIISQDSCRWLRSKIDEKSHEFSKTMRTKGPTSTRGNPMRIYQLISNLKRSSRCWRCCKELKLALCHPNSATISWIWCLAVSLSRGIKWLLSTSTSAMFAVRALSVTWSALFWTTKPMPRGCWQRKYSSG
ncbi:hypothetical protein J3F84DRAFT_258900 [Trichoderma pleuroticola]